MDVKKPVTGIKEMVGAIGGRQRRALARLGLASAGAYVAPTMLALRSTVVIASPAAKTGVAA